MRIELDSAIVTPDKPVRFTIAGEGAAKASVRVLEWSGFVGHTPTIKTSTPKRPRWELAISRLPPELYAARQRVRVVVGIVPQGAKRPIRKTLVLHLAPAIDELPSDEPTAPDPPAPPTVEPPSDDQTPAPPTPVEVEAPAPER